MLFNDSINRLSIPLPISILPLYSNFLRKAGSFRDPKSRTYTEDKLKGMSEDELRSITNKTPDLKY